MTVRAYTTVETMLSAAWLAAALAVLPAAWAGMYAQPVVHLDARTFKKVMATEHAAMVAFVAPWCGHCKNLGPEYTAAAQSLSPLIPFYAVDCDDASNRGLCAEYGVQGFPTIKAFPRAGKGGARDYQGERKRAALVDYAKGLVPDRVKKLRVDGAAVTTVQKFLDEKPTLPHALLVHPTAPSIPFLWKVLGHRLTGKMHLGYVKDSADHSILSALGVYDPEDTTRDATRALVWQSGASRAELIEYQGSLKFNSLLEWLDAIAEGKEAPPVEKDDAPKQKPVKAPQQEAGSTSNGESAAEAKARRQAKLDEAERRDKLRREKQAAAAAAAAQANGGSKTEDAPDPVPVESVDESKPIASSAAGGAAADPSPASDAEESVVEAKETHVHEEL